ncbi:LOW QUALITY PROTEIN: uncharacterized protein Dere_GG27181 [Drosophila erecta]|uniref:Uncharacterized protein n=1 Tax=Drosophila erecta TaxID=7220 RepID=A0A0Q5VZ94_DROER|nr:LOW QUALITY PROTEIN: uncharacterized protein Dere_GG27181 [Drosophila erecta]
MFCLSGVLVSLLAHLFPRKPKDVITKQQWGKKSDGQNKTSVTGYTSKKFKNNLIKMKTLCCC